MARISLVPQRREFYDLYNQAATNNVEIARLLVRLLDGFPNDRDTLARDIKDAEHEGDRLTHEVVDLLNRTFVTPFDRDDMYRLASALDDICDHVDEATGNILGYGVTRDPAERATAGDRDRARGDEAAGGRRQARGLQGLAARADRAARARGRGRPAEPRGDRGAVRVRRRTRSSIIRWKDIHEQLEEAVDACENAADVLEAILVKNR